MANKTNQLFNLNKLGFSLSFLCAIHCAVTPFLVTALPLMGAEFIISHEFEWILLTAGVFIAAYVLMRDYWKIHHKTQAIQMAILGFGIIFFGHTWQVAEAWLAVLGGFVLLYAYLLNWKLIRQAQACVCEVAQ